MDIFSVLSRHMDWLGQRQAVTAANVANADTPGYRARKISDFDSALTKAGGMALTTTSPLHMTGLSATESFGSYESSTQNNAEASRSGNDVSLEREMADVGDTSQRFSLDTGLERTFQRMFLTSVKS